MSLRCSRNLNQRCYHDGVVPASFPFTLMAWAMPASLPTSASGDDYHDAIAMADLRTGANLSATGIGISAFWNAGAPKWDLGTSANDFVANTTPVVNRWDHLCIVVPDNTVKRIYVNGIQDRADGSEVGGLSVNSTVCFGHFGSSTNGSGGTTSLSGDFRLRHGKLWSAALSQQEVLKEMWASVPVRQQDLRLWLPLQTTGDTYDRGPYNLGPMVAGSVPMTTEDEPAVLWRPTSLRSTRRSRVFIPLNSTFGAPPTTTPVPVGWFDPDFVITSLFAIDMIVSPNTSPRFDRDMVELVLGTTYNDSMSGGLIAGGQFLVTITVPGSGPATVSGTANSTSIYNTPTLGGATISGVAAISWTPIVSGSVNVTGAAALAMKVPASGAAVVGGQALPTTQVTMVGGTVLSGTSLVTVNVTEAGTVTISGTATAGMNRSDSMSGGVVIFGTALPAITLGSTMSGGVIVSGSAASAWVCSNVMVGGAGVFGSAAGQWNATASAVGGAVIAGSGAVSLSCFGSGGAVIGGTASSPLNSSLSMSGTIIVNGTTAPILATKMSGGAVTSGQTAPVLGVVLAGAITVTGTSTVKTSVAAAGTVNMGGSVVASLISGVTMSGAVNVAGSALANISGGYSVSVMNKAPAGYWRLGDVVGSATAADSSGHSFTGTVLSGVTFGDDALIQFDSNTAATLTTASTGISVADNATLDTTSGFTAECWVKFTSSPASGETRWLIGKWDGATSRGWKLTCEPSSGGWRAFVQNATGSAAATYSGLIDTNTHHVVMTYDGSTIRLYVDGVERNNVARSGGVPATSASVLIGGS
jgi:hypothetical protein